jgi:hypothetical protein
MSKFVGAILILVSVSSVAMAASAVPEIDPASAFSGLTLIAGSLMMLRGRRVKK